MWGNKARKMRERLGAKVQLRYRQGKGSVEVRFFTDDDLDRIEASIYQEADRLLDLKGI